MDSKNPNFTNEIKEIADIADRPGWEALLRILRYEIEQTTDKLLMSVASREVTDDNLAFLRAFRKVEAFVQTIGHNALQVKDEIAEFETRVPKVFDISKVN
jgi:hypothetical protein